MRILSLLNLLMVPLLLRQFGGGEEGEEQESISLADVRSKPPQYLQLQQ